MKIARRAWYERGEPDRMTVLCASGAFHGRTIGMLAATDRPAFRPALGRYLMGLNMSPLAT